MSYTTRLGMVFTTPPIKIVTGWCYTYPSENMSSSIEMMTFPPTRWYNWDTGGWWILTLFYPTSLSGWWFHTIPKIWKSDWIIIPNIWDNQKCSKPLTSFGSTPCTILAPSLLVPAVGRSSPPNSPGRCQTPQPNSHPGRKHRQTSHEKHETPAKHTCDTPVVHLLYTRFRFDVVGIFPTCCSPLRWFHSWWPRTLPVHAGPWSWRPRRPPRPGPSHRQHRTSASSSYLAGGVQRQDPEQRMSRENDILMTNTVMYHIYIYIDGMCINTYCNYVYLFIIRIVMVYTSVTNLTSITSIVILTYSYCTIYLYILIYVRFGLLIL